MMRQKTSQRKGKLRIGDDWNAITIIALSQTNPLKAIAECIENSIDAKARTISVIRGKERGEHYLKIIDDGQGIPRDKDGRPDFTYVATHICDSIKRELKKGGAQGLQGEFGIGLLSFWTVGEELTMTSAGVDGRNPWDDFHSLQKELDLYMPGLSRRKSVVVANKMDLEQAVENFSQVKEAIADLVLYGLAKPETGGDAGHQQSSSRPVERSGT